ncbi:venom carboxylesterase-6-like [Copidosoma floridanum]|uniref:venom carboxylesterase-6-like n=1 Tax=Copidosoma floridanum TaxID=29053 RepID=UPI0006C9651B|nr:venom carboxylesterase-6-like [Copidosoma floridanum]
MVTRALALLLFIALVCAYEDAPFVVTPLGSVVGYYKTSYKGRRYEVYEGIPYAEPPVNQSRFEEAVPFSTPWGQLDARKAKSPCAQYVDVPADENGQTVTEGRVNGEDDCLYLNINVPVVARYRPRGMPVVFFIHGGSFQYGSGSSFAENNIYMMDRDVVFVSINYRLGVQGFLSTEDEVLPGNLGLKDQSLALQWTADNIGHFGGDPRKITLVGFSAGGSSVQYHYLSPRSRGLFHSGVAISGAVFNPWGFTTHAAEKARKLGAIFNCPTHDSRPMVDCLKKVPAQDLAAATKHFQYWQYMPEAPFAPVVETSGPRPFIDKSPEDVAEAGELYDVPIVFSIVSEEGCDPGSAYAPHDNLLKQLNDNWTEIAPHLLEYNYTLPEEVHERVALAARRKYFGDGGIDNNSTRILIRLLTDEQYSIGIEKSLRVQAEESTSPVYFYYYSYRGSSSRSEHLSHTKNNYGVCHCDDVLMVVDNSQPGNKTKEELAMIDLLLDVWETVAKDGVPKLGVEWRPVNTSNPEIEYMHIRGPKDYGMSGSDNFGNKYFWNEFFDLF